MLVRLASLPASPGKANEDYAAVAPHAAVLLDGAGFPASVGDGCAHGVAWFARTLGALYLAEITGSTGRTLAAGLGVAIDVVRGLHADTCDVKNPASPSATVVATRWLGGDLEYLVLADSTLVLDMVGGPPVVLSDGREGEIGRRYRRDRDSLAIGSPEHSAALHRYVEAMTGHRNRPGGFWVASVDPAAGDHAITGSVPLAELSSVALLSDGASRLVDKFALTTWPDVAALLKSEGPEELIRRVRAAEAADPHGRRWPRGKGRDDATAVVCKPDESP